MVISDKDPYGRDSEQFTYVSDAHSSTSWLDHIVCSHDVNTKINSIKILDKLPSSDHLPMQMTLAIGFNNVIDFTVNSCFRDKGIYNWSKCTSYDLSQYCTLTCNYFDDIHVTSGVKCNDPNCKLSSHRSDIDDFYTQICDVLDKASTYCIPSTRSNYYKDHIVLILMSM